MALKTDLGVPPRSVPALPGSFPGVYVSPPEFQSGSLGRLAEGVQAWGAGGEETPLGEARGGWGWHRSVLGWALQRSREANPHGKGRPRSSQPSPLSRRDPPLLCSFSFPAALQREVRPWNFPGFLKCGQCSSGWRNRQDDLLWDRDSFDLAKVAIHQV